MLDFERLMIPIIPTHVCNLDNRYWFNSDIRDYGLLAAAFSISSSGINGVRGFPM